MSVTVFYTCVWTLFDRRCLIIPGNNLLKEMPVLGMTCKRVTQFSKHYERLLLGVTVFALIFPFHNRCTNVKRASGCLLCPMSLISEHESQKSYLVSNSTWGTKTLSLSVPLWPTKLTSTCKTTWGVMLIAGAVFYWQRLSELLLTHFSNERMPHIQLSQCVWCKKEGRAVRGWCRCLRQLLIPPFFIETLDPVLLPCVQTRLLDIKPPSWRRTWENTFSASSLYMLAIPVVT